MTHAALSWALVALAALTACAPDPTPPASDGAPDLPNSRDGAPEAGSDGLASDGPRDAAVPRDGTPDGTSDATVGVDATADAVADAAPAATVARFDRTAGPNAELFALPYPNVLRQRGDNTIDLASLSTGNPALLQQYVDLVAGGRFGFASNGPIFFRFSGPLDETSLPATLADSRGPGAAVLLVDVDPASPDVGQRVPFSWKFSAQAGKYIGDNALVLVPAYGAGLRPSTTYAAVVTSQVLDANGKPVIAASSFEALLAAQPQAGDEAAHQAYAPLRAFLAGEKITNAVAAALFTTGDHVGLAIKLRDTIKQLPAPVANKLVVTAETAGYREVQGTYDAPNFQQGTPPFTLAGGAIDLTSSGAPAVARNETLRFAITIPKGPMPGAGWPLVLFAHGTGGDFRTFITSGVAAGLSRIVDASGQEVSRVAVASIDQTLHGARAPAGTNPAATFINILNPTASVFNVLQGATDNVALLRMAKGLSFSSLPSAGGSGLPATVGFGGQIKLDPQRLGFIGHSQGGITGALFAGVEPEIGAAVLSGSGGVFALTVLARKTPIDFAQLIASVIQEPIDAFHPVTMILQQLLEPADPINYAPLVLRRPPAGSAPKHVLLTQGIVDQQAPLGTSDALGVALGCPLAGSALRPVTNADLLGLPVVGYPLSGNLLGTAQITGAMLQYEGLPVGVACASNTNCGPDEYCDDAQQCRRDGHYVIFDRAEAAAQYRQFLGSYFRDGTPTLTAP